MLNRYSITTDNRGILDPNPVLQFLDLSWTQKKKQDPTKISGSGSLMIYRGRCDIIGIWSGRLRIRIIYKKISDQVF